MAGVVEIFWGNHLYIVLLTLVIIASI